MVPQMVFHEGADEVVAVVVTGVAAQGQRLGSRFTGLLQQVRVQLLGQELVGQPLVHQDALGKQRRQATGVALADQLGRVVRGPGTTVWAQVASESFLAPRALHGRADGRDGAEAGKRSGWR